MAYTAFPARAVGDPITKDFFDLVKSNDADHEARILSLATSGGSVFIFNGDIDFVGFSMDEPDIFYYKARQDFSVNDFRAQLFSKQGIVSGDLSIDLQKSVDTNNSNFASILTGDLELDFAVESDYDEVVATIDAGLNDILTGEVLRVKITNIPTAFHGKILLSIGAQ